MTALFVPDTPAGRPTALAYEDLRQDAELATGRAARPKRIFKLSYRHDGADQETAVGTPATPETAVVDAIFDVGDAYAMMWRGGHQILPKRQTYDALEFD